VDHLDHLRRLSIDGDEHPGEHPDATVDLDAKTRSLVRIGALVAVSASAASMRKEVDDAVSSGARPAEIAGVLDAIMPHVGRPRVVKAAPKVLLALGVELDLLTDES
jgi:4-carboxymuconolactone decarboxylase